MTKLSLPLPCPRADWPDNARLTHHVHILEMNGESFRLKQSKTKIKTSAIRLTPWVHRSLPRAPPRQPVEGTPRRARGPPMDYGDKLFTKPKWYTFTPPRGRILLRR